MDDCNCLVIPDEDFKLFDVEEPFDEDEFYGQIEGLTFIETPNLPHDVIWKNILAESDAKYQECVEYKNSKLPKEPQAPKNPALAYLDRNVFPLLLKCLECTISEARRQDIMKHQKSRFNAIDNLAEMLWNLNPRYPERAKQWLPISNIQWVQDWLEENPRPIYPKSWLWNTETATIKIQSYIRGYFVRKTDEVQEMRQFWKDIKQETEENRLKAIHERQADQERADRIEAELIVAEAMAATAAEEEDE